MRIARPLAVLAASAAVATGLSGCQQLFAPSAEVAFRPADGAAVVLDPQDPSAASIAASAELFDRSQLAFVASGPAAASLADDAASLRVPLLVAGPGVRAELERLGATTVARAAGDDAGELGGVTVVDVDPQAVDAGTLPRPQITADSPGAVLFTDGGPLDAAVGAAAGANIQAASGSTVDLPGGDPRATSASVAAVREHAGQHVLAVGQSIGPTFPERHTAAATQPELPGGGQLPLEGKLLIADYGQPGDPLLGVLGERGLDAAVQHVKAQAAQYEGLTDRTVVPTFEIITTVASGSLGDGDYSTEASVEDLRPWVERAGEEGIYVVLDLQPGYDTFLDQAKQYEELLAMPHVGLALDSEWRLKPGQRHLEQIGSVSAAEINTTLDWLAQLTAQRGLPQKAVVLHQFTHDMITDRETVDTSHDELALLVHVDGHGAPADKMATWNSLLEDLPAGIRLGWKNFIDEDTPMFTPQQTVAVEPLPSFVSYQ